MTPDAGAINVTWTPATGPHTDTITRYALWVYDQDTPLVWSTIHGYAPSTHSARVEGLTPDTTTSPSCAPGTRRERANPASPTL